MNTMVQLFVISPTLFSTIFYFFTGFCILLVILLFIIAFSVTVSLIIVSLVHIFCNVLHPHFHEIQRNDLETGETFPPLGEEDHDDEAFRASSTHNNLQILEMLDRIIRDLGEGRGSRRNKRMHKVLERLPPQVSYGSQELKTSSNRECVICLEDFETGDSCQVFPICNHIFHSICLRNWMTKNLTCPLCRSCILESE